jgi:hypothetical protein
MFVCLDTKSVIYYEKDIGDSDEDPDDDLDI